MFKNCNITLPEAVQMASTVPAEALGHGESKGSIAVGFDADIVVFGEEENSFKVYATFLGGQCKYSILDN